MRQSYLIAIVVVAVSAYCAGATPPAQTDQIVRLDNERDGSLLNPAPHPTNRAILVTKSRPLSPPFIVEQPIASRPAAYMHHVRQPDSSWYGAPANLQVRAYVRIPSTPGSVIQRRAVGVDPFARIPDQLPRRYRDAQRQWLREHYLVNRARVVRRAPTPAALLNPIQLGETVQIEEPQPRATIKLDPALELRSGGDQEV